MTSKHIPKFYPRGMMSALVTIEREWNGIKGRRIIRGSKLEYNPGGVCKVFQGDDKTWVEFNSSDFVSVEDIPAGM